MGTVYRVLGEAKIAESPTYTPDRLIVEECENIHVHYRDVRIEMSEEEFHVFAKTMVKASETLKRKMLTIGSVNPYDESHWQGYEVEDERHREGIELVKKLIVEGKKILPILVRPNGDGTYQRLDGFKRYMAYKQLGHGLIQCIVDPEAPRGGQEGMEWEEKD